MKTLSQKAALIFAIINILPAIFGILMIWALVPVPGLILYSFYWLAWRNKLTLNAERTLWVATFIYNFFLLWLGKYDKDFSFETFGIIYQSISAIVAVAALTSTFNSSVSIIQTTSENTSKFN